MENNRSGILLIDKHSGPTSHDIVDEVRKLLEYRKIGHLGTLDPMATGLLILAVGKATRSAQGLVKGEKEYRFEVKLGEFTDTDDAQGKLISKHDIDEDDVRERINDVVNEFRGQVEQIPPKFSAIKKNGVPLYKLARKKINFTVQSRKVYIFDLKIEKIKLPIIQIYIRCSSGTYVRSICRDIGKVLDCGGHASYIRRLACGEYRVEDASNLKDIKKMPVKARWEALKEVD